MLSRASSDQTVRMQPAPAWLGLGDVISRILAALGVQPCDACRRRAMALNALAPKFFRWPWESSRQCTMYAGRCTGFGTQQCVTAPESLSPDATVITQCCAGWFQYPWIQICEGEPPRRGCGFCLW